MLDWCARLMYETPPRIQEIYDDYKKQNKQSKNSIVILLHFPLTVIHRMQADVKIILKQRLAIASWCFVSVVTIVTNVNILRYCKCLNPRNVRNRLGCGVVSATFLAIDSY